MGNLALMNLSRLAPEILEKRRANLCENRERKGLSDPWESLGSPDEEGAAEKDTTQRKPRLAVRWE